MSREKVSEKREVLLVSFSDFAHFVFAIIKAIIITAIETGVIIIQNMASACFSIIHNSPAANVIAPEYMSVYLITFRALMPLGDSSSCLGILRPKLIFESGPIFLPITISGKLTNSIDNKSVRYDKYPIYIDSSIT